MENEIVYQKSYAQFKEECDTVVKQTAESFVRLGYLLKVARDTDILKESAYNTVAEFAEAEYGLNATYVSRFISINDRFSEGGYSDQLESKYQGFGYAKLSVMLQLPDAMNEELSADMTKADITAVKDEFDAERKVTDIERMIEPQAEAPELPMRLQLLYKTLDSLGESEPETFLKVAKSADLENTESRVVLAMVPSDTKVYSVRVMGLGRMMLTCSEDKVSIVNSRTADKQLYTWAEVKQMWEEIGAIEELPFPNKPEERWEKHYGRKLEIAPVQEEKKETKKKEPKVVKAKEATKTDTHATEAENKSNDSENENQGFENESHDFENDSCEDDNGEVEDEANDGNPGEDDYSDEAENAIEVKTWAGDTIVVEGPKKEAEPIAAVGEFVDDSHEPTPIEIELAECINLLDGWRTELCKPELTSRGVREMKDNMVPLIAQAMGRLASALWDKETEDDEEDEGE